MQRYALSQITAPTKEPLHIAEVKEHLRIDRDDEDARLKSLVTAARIWCENRASLQLVAAALRLSLDAFPDAESGGDFPDSARIRLPRSPLLSVTSIAYIGTNGASTTWASSNYSVDTYSEPGRIEPVYGQTWPTARSQQNAVTVQFKAGYVVPFTAAASDVLTLSGTTGTNGDVWRLSNSGGGLPVGLQTELDYYVISTTGATISLSTSSGGTAVDITSAGSGYNFLGVVPETVKQAMLLLIGHWYENREAVLVGPQSKPIEMAVDALLSLSAVGVYP